MRKGVNVSRVYVTSKPTELSVVYATKPEVLEVLSVVVRDIAYASVQPLESVCPAYLLQASRCGMLQECR